jgi:tetratricopeptide (TPR) repeat protein
MLTDQAGVGVREQQSGGGGRGEPRRGPGQGRPGQGRIGGDRPGQTRRAEHGGGERRQAQPRRDGQRRQDGEPSWDGQRPPDGQQGKVDGRRAERPPRPQQPDIPADVTADQLDRDVRQELRSLPRDLAGLVGRHLAAAQRAQQAGDAEDAYQHAHAARTLAARIGVVRETCGVAAYLAGRWAEALAELRAARRMTGRSSLLPMMADCERALGRPERALALVTGPDAKAADRAVQIELLIVESGLRRDMGPADVGVVTLQVPELTDGRQRPWSARLYYAYADALLDAGRVEGARDWFARAAAADTAGETDAGSRFDELDEVSIEDLEDLEEA